MALKISEHFRKAIFNNKSFVTSSAWSFNSQRGVKSFEEIPKAPQLSDEGCLPYFFKAGGQTHMHKYIDGLHKSLGPIFVAKLKKDIVFISDAESNVQIFHSEGKYPKRDGVESWKLYLEETGKIRGLFFMDDEKWIEARRIFNNILLKPDSMEYHVKSISAVSKNFVEVLKTNLPKTLKHHIYYWNVECIGEIALGTNLGFIETLKQEGLDSKEVREKQEFVNALFNVYVESAKLADVQEPLTTLRDTKTEPWPSFCDAMGTMLKYGERYVQGAILNSLTHEQVYENTDYPAEEERIRESVVYKALIEEWMDQDIIAGVVLDLFLGSPDTSSHTALWAIYLLGRNPEVASKAREQIFSVLKERPEEFLSLSTLNKITYLDGIIREALRLYSVAPFINRTLPVDIELCDYSIPAGTTVMSSLLTMGRDPNYYSDPESFRPDRWFRENRNKGNMFLNRKAFTPFAFGGRSCVGKKIAELDLSLLLMELLKNFEWTVEEEVDSILKIITVPDRDMKVNFKPL